MFDEFNIYINKKCKYWTYILNDDLWKILLDNLIDNKLIISVFSKKHVLENDIILIYLKSKKKSGFVGVAQVESDMMKNEEKIKIFGDLNTDKYIAKLGTIHFLNSKRVNITKFEQIFFNSATYTTRNQFIGKMLIGECVLREITEIGQEMTKLILTLINEYINQDNSEDTSEESKQTAIEIENNNKNDDSIDQSDTESSDNNDSDNNDSDSDNESESETSSINSNDDKSVVTTIPNMMVPCKKLINNIKKSKNQTKTIKLILEHHSKCYECDLTDNNNKRPLQTTLNRLKIKEIIYQKNDHEECLDAYHNLKRYPDDENVLYCKIFWIANDPHFSKCILFEYTSIKD